MRSRSLPLCPYGQVLFSSQIFSSQLCFPRASTPACRGDLLIIRCLYKNPKRGGGSSQGVWLFIEHKALRGASSEQGLRGTFGWLWRRNRRAFCRSRWSCHAWEPAQPSPAVVADCPTPPPPKMLHQDPLAGIWGRHREAEHRHNSPHPRPPSPSIQLTTLVSSFL